MEEKQIPFDLLSDPGNAVAAAFGVRFVLSGDLRAVNRSLGLDLPSFNGDDSWSLPIHARFILDTKGRVRYAVHDPDFTKRTSTEHTLSALRDLA